MSSGTQPENRAEDLSVAQQLLVTDALARQLIVDLAEANNRADSHRHRALESSLAFALFKRRIRLIAEKWSCDHTGFDEILAEIDGSS